MQKLEDILCVQETRQVAKDNTVSYKAKRLQIPKDAYGYHYARKTVQVREYHDGTMSLSYGPRLLGYYDQAGHLKLIEKTAKAA